MGRGEGFAPFLTKMGTHKPRFLPAGVGGSEGTRSSWPVGGPARQGARSPAQERARSRLGPPKWEAVRRLPRGPRAPAPAQPVSGSGSFINQQLGERAAL